jgi:hypothetical protein
MMRLTTRSLGVVEDEYAVTWRAGTKRKGILYIEGIEVGDPLVAAELVAIRHLLFTMKIFNRDIIAGTGIEIQSSSSLIKKLYRGKSTKKHLQHLSHFMQTSLQGVTLSATDENDEFLPSIGDEVLVEYISASDKPQYDVVKTLALGDLRLTKHAIDKYAERNHSGAAKNPLISLVGRLKHPDLKRQPLPDKAARHKLRKYGSIDNLEIWGHDTSQMHYIVVRDPNSRIGTLVTVYKRHPTYAEV